MSMLERTPVASSNVLSIGHDAAARELHVEFRSQPGVVWVYADVDAEVYVDLMAAESIGSYFSRHIRTRFVGSKKVETVDAAV